MKRRTVVLLCMGLMGFAFSIMYSGCSSDATPPADTTITETPSDIPYGISQLPATDQQYLEDFSTALQQFQNLSSQDFIDTYGPDKQYMTSLGYAPGSAQYLDLIQSAYSFTDDQLAAYDDKGFVVADSIGFPTVFVAYKDIFANDLPVYITVDSMLDALHLSFDRILMDVEENILIGKLDTMLSLMDEHIGGLSPQNEAETQAYDDAAMWICTARSLLAGGKIACSRPVDGTVELFLSYVHDLAISQVVLFGASVKEDFSQFKPRGHYTKTEALKKYFRAMMWIQRIGMDFVRYQRHAIVAATLTTAAVDSGALEPWNVINNTIEAIVGTSDSLNLSGMQALLEATDIQTPTQLADDAVYEHFAQTAIARGAGKQRINSMILAGDPTDPAGFTPIPPAFHLMGQRFIVDSFVFTNVVYDRVQGRYMPSPLDAWFVLGNRATVPLLADEITTYDYQANLAALDYLVGGYDNGFWNANQYNYWLQALMIIDRDTTGSQYPEVMRTAAWDKRILNTQLASWAHLRHDTILYAKQSYTGEICEYPDAWVDPYPAFYEKLAAYAGFTLNAFEGLGIFEFTGEWREDDEQAFYGSMVKYYLQNLKQNMTMLGDIARAELAQQRLTDAQLTFVKQLVRAEGMCGGPAYTGWYTDLIYNYADENAEVFDPTIADVHTDPNGSGSVLHVGVGQPNLTLISVKTDCGVTAYVGPSMSYYEMVRDGLDRMTDAQWKTMLETTAPERPAWTEEIVK